MTGLTRWMQSRLRRWTVSGALLACGLAGVDAHALAPLSLRFEQVGTEQGLPQETVLNIVQDREGFMWFGTQAGLARFDGYTMKVFKNDPADRASIPDNYVLCSFHDGKGRLWFGTKGGLARFDRASQKFVRDARATPAGVDAANRAVLAIVGDGLGGLWLATGGGLEHVDPDSARVTSWRNDPADHSSLRDDRVTALALDAAGALWIGTSRGLDRLRAGASRFEHLRIGAANAGASNDNVLALSIGPQQTLWIGTAAGLEAWQIGAEVPQRRHLRAADGMDEGRIETLYHDPDGTLWVGTEHDGVKRRDRASGDFVGTVRQPLDRHGLPDSQVSAILVDRGGTLWVGNRAGGASRVDLASGGFSRASHLPDRAESLSDSKVRTMRADDGGRLWLGTTNGGLNLFDPATASARHWRHDPRRHGSLPDDSVTALEMSGGRLWIGAPSGLCWFDPASERFTPLALGTEANANYIQYLKADRAGALWAISRGGLHQIGPDGVLLRSWRHDPRDPASLGENYGFALLEDRHGALWVGTDNGLDRLDRASGRFTHFRHDPANPASLRHNRISYLFESANGTLWVGTAGGLHRVEDGAGAPGFRFVPLTESGTADPIGALQEERGGALWISTTAGITRLDPASGRFKAYTARDGLLEGSYFIGAAARTPDGALHFGGGGGLTSFVPETIRTNPFAPTVVITDFRVFDRPYGVGGAIGEARAVTLEHRESALSFEFAALHYADPGRNRYAYQLEGFDHGWVETGAARRFATYTNLDPGPYTFRVKASNKDGVWSAAPATLAITILQPVWKTWWLRLLTAALLLGAAAGAYRWRIRALLQQKTWLEREVGARTHELVQQKESVELQKRELERQKETVELAHRNISLLSEIGRQITATLDSESIMLMLYDHVNELMDASVFGIGVYRPDSATIDYPFAIERGKRYAPYSRRMDEPNQLAVWCITQRREVFINDLETEYGRYIEHLALTSGDEHMGTLEDGSLPTAPRSLLYVPIAVNGRMLGVVTVHSYRQNAYRPIDLDMLRTLASYVGVAFDNADAYRQLKDTRNQLVAQDKLAALGSLVAGVAHELNTPIGNSVLMASALQEKTTGMAVKFDAQELRRSELGAFIAAAQEASALILRSLLNAADLVSSFKQVAVDQASAQRRRFKLDQVVHEIIATMMNQVRKAGHTITVDVAPGIEMDSYPGPFGQVVINFINNALLHAFEYPGGQMRLSAVVAAGGRVQIEFHDNGCGVPLAHQARIFDPFFTTRMGQGGTGLGLNIAYNIVNSLLEGSIRVESEPGQGTRFLLDLPMRVSGQAR
jgi:ligand-binding sensor domain-containing protein/signal transduction histidine kinase